MDTQVLDEIGSAQVADICTPPDTFKGSALLFWTLLECVGDTRPAKALEGEPESHYEVSCSYEVPIRVDLRNEWYRWLPEERNIKYPVLGHLWFRTHPGLEDVANAQEQHEEFYRSLQGKDGAALRKGLLNKVFDRLDRESREWKEVVYAMMRHEHRLYLPLPEIEERVVSFHQLEFESDFWRRHFRSHLRYRLRLWDYTQDDHLFTVKEYPQGNGSAKYALQNGDPEVVQAHREMVAFKRQNRAKGRHGLYEVKPGFWLASAVRSKR
jgi:hypothetical protein